MISMSLFSALILSAWCVLFSYGLGITNNPLGLSITASLLVLIIGSDLLFRAFKRRSSLPYLMAYISYSVLIILGFSLQAYLTPQPVIAIELLLSTSFLAIVPGAWNVLKSASEVDLVPQMVILYAMLSILYIPNFLVGFILASLSTALIGSKKSYIGLALAMGFLPLPIVSISSFSPAPLPYYSLQGLIPSELIGSEYTAVLLYAFSFVGGLIAGAVSLAIRRHRRPPESFKDLSKFALMVALPPVTYILAFGGGIALALNNITAGNVFLFPLALTIALSVPFAGGIEGWLLVRKAFALRKQLRKELGTLVERVDLIEDAIKKLGSTSINKEGVKKIELQLQGLKEMTKALKGRIGRTKYNYAELKSAYAELSNLKGLFKELENALIGEYQQIIQLLRKAIPIARSFGSIDRNVDLRLLEMASAIKDVEDILSNYEIVEDISKTVCESTVSGVRESFKEVKELLGVDFQLKINECGVNEDPFGVIEKVVDAYASAFSSVERQIIQAYDLLVRFKLVVRDSIARLGNVPLEDMSVIKRLNDIQEMLKDVDAIPPNFYGLPRFIKSRLQEVVNELPKLLDDSRKDLSRIRAELMTYEVKVARNVVILLDNFEPIIRESNAKIMELVNMYGKVPYKEILKLMVTEGAEALTRLADVVKDASLILTRAKLIPMVFDYFDWIIDLMDGTVSLNEIPFTDEAVIWFLRFYVVAKPEVTISDRHLIKGG